MLKDRRGFRSRGVPSGPDTMMRSNTLAEVRFLARRAVRLITDARHPLTSFR